MGLAKLFNCQTDLTPVLKWTEIFDLNSHLCSQAAGWA